MMRIIFYCAIVGLLLSCEIPTKEDSEEWQLVWFDEFDGFGSPDTEKWTLDEGDGCPQLCGWGNNESQYYTVDNPSNARIEDGKLIIEAHHKPIGYAEFSSAKLYSKPSGVWQYGKFVIKAKLPKGRGLWPAVWMMPVDSKYGTWPNSGEIDILEHVGYLPDSIFGTVHTGAYNHMFGTQKGGAYFQKNISENWNEYYAIWDEDAIEFGINGTPYFTFHKESNDPKEWPFDEPFYLILNLTVGGNWGGKMGIDTSVFPQRFEVDYVRVYKRL